MKNTLFASLFFHLALASIFWMLWGHEPDPSSLSTESYSVSIGHTLLNQPPSGTHSKAALEEAKDLASAHLQSTQSSSATALSQATGADQRGSSVDRNTGKQKELYSSYIATLVRKINEHKSYPRSSQLRHETGEVKISFSIQANGDLEQIRIIEKSPFEELNEAALSAVIRTKSIPPIPSELHQQTIELTLPIVFKQNTF